ncbi:Hypothetical protein DEACI_3958 [Acididesulfobacillus acetoxydans]|uniref:Uncharacterized protein n=1 Tax=Acididesulfobacillus acetoxydans TaxID=1561005 RepID=A0A8S0Y4M9_9FIRM|nr:hypothetical protein [Acididesulfobacillus acetoxydans]CAA7603135.1 Hypothetical protein DEACI_3958 [Acididesulfobacillus acetoxydans]CEJ07637.1 Hypothetical protein DEACI_2103 [Acididesulfobacillus acetoxydans]
MPFINEIHDKIREYVYGHLPSKDWYDKNFYPFIKDANLRERLIVEYKNSRVIYKIFEGLQAEGELLLAQIKTQVIMYVSIQEAVINYILFELLVDQDPVRELLYQERLTQIMIPKYQKEKLQKELVHDGKEILIYYKEKKPIDKTKIRYDQKVNSCYHLKLIDSQLREDLIKLYEYRNTVHIEAELRKNLDYNLEMGLLAYRRVEGLSIQLTESLNLYLIH